MLCLLEHGGMVISIRDWLGGEERMGCPLKLELEEESDSEAEKEEEKPAPSNGFGSLLGGGTTTTTEQRAKTELSEVLLDREALKTNEVVVVAIGEEVNKKANDPGSFASARSAIPFPMRRSRWSTPRPGCSRRRIPSARSGSTLLLVRRLLGLAEAHGADLPRPAATSSSLGHPTPTPIEPEFLRTGLLGTVIEGRIFVLGLYEDRIRQKVEWVEHGTEIAEHRYFFVQHIVVSIMKSVPQDLRLLGFRYLCQRGASARGGAGIPGRLDGADHERRPSEAAGYRPAGLARGEMHGGATPGIPSPRLLRHDYRAKLAA